MQGTVAIYLKSESGDDYLHLYENTHSHEIVRMLREEMEMFSPLADYGVVANNEDFQSEMYTLMEQILKESWED